MANCPACEAELVDDDYSDMELDEEVDCPECGELIRVSGLSPLEFELASDDEDDEEFEEKDEAADLEDEEENEEDWEQ